MQKDNCGGSKSITEIICYLDDNIYYEKIPKIFFNIPNILKFFGKIPNLLKL